MADFNVRADSVNVEQIMEQIRARIRERRGIDYTEQQIRDLAAVKLEKFLDPRGVRSDLLEQFRRAQTPNDLPNYVFEETTLYETHRGGAPERPPRERCRGAGAGGAEGVAAAAAAEAADPRPRS